MLSKVKALSHKKIFAIGLTLVLGGSTLSQINLITMIIGGSAIGLGFAFIIIASNKKHSNTNKHDKR